MGERSVTLQQLKILLAVARHASFTRASQELHVSQPALSLHVRQLEEGSPSSTARERE